MNKMTPFHLAGCREDDSMFSLRFRGLVNIGNTTAVRLMSDGSKNRSDEELR